MNKFLTIILAITFITLSTISCNAQTSEKLNTDKTTIIMYISNPVMTINGEERQIDSEVAPIIQNSRTLVPVRTIIEAMGGSVNWNEENKEIMLSIDDDIIKLTIDKMTAYLNDKKYIIDIPPVIIDSRTMLPIRFIAENFGFDVDWNESNQRITITKQIEAVNKIEGENENMFDIKLTINSQTFDAKFYDNQTTRKLVKNFPVTYHMNELNSNEKYYYMQDNFPTDSQYPASINIGDIMLYGSNCLVVFYKDFSSNYSYTKLGYVENIDGFAKALGSGSIDITFDK